MGSGVKTVSLFTSRGCLGGGCRCPNSQIEFEGQGRPCGIGNTSFFATCPFFFFKVNQKVIFKNRKHTNLWGTNPLKEPQFVFVLIRVETEQPIVICLSNPKWPGHCTSGLYLFLFSFFPSLNKCYNWITVMHWEIWIWWRTDGLSIRRVQSEKLN